MAKARPANVRFSGPPWFLVDRATVAIDPTTGTFDAAGGGVVCKRFDEGSAVLLFSDEEWAADFARRSGNPDWLSAKSNTAQDFITMLEGLAKAGNAWVAIDYARLSLDEQANLAPIGELITAVRAMFLPRQSSS